MKKALFWLIVFILYQWWNNIFAQNVWYIIDNYHIQMDLHENWSADIQEHITVKFSESKHGIYRDIPIGIKWDYLAIENISSNTNIHNISTKNNLLSLQLWSPDTTIIGYHTYNIDYTVKNIIKTFTWWDEIYRNIIWWQWDTTINNITWNINLPKDYIAYSGSSFAVWWWSGEQRIDTITFQPINAKQRQWSFRNILQSWQGITVWLQFSWNYFTLPADYDTYFTKKITHKLYGESRRETLISTIGTFLPFILPFLFWITIVGNSILKHLNNSPRKSDKPIVTQYEPPKDLNPSYAFYLRYNNKYEPKVFTALLYYRATHGWVTIQKKVGEQSLFWKRSEQYSIEETSLKPEGTSNIDDILLQRFFWAYDTTLDKIYLSESSYIKINKLISTLEQEFQSQWFTQKRNWFWWVIGMKELTVYWSEIFEHLRGYKEYLSKVEQPVIESEIKSDPDFINKILPWAVLFWVETRLLKMVEEVLKKIQWYQSNDGSYLTANTLHTMNKNFTKFSIPPRSSGTSGFSSWGSIWKFKWWFSGWWRGGGGWRSW